MRDAIRQHSRRRPSFDVRYCRFCFALLIVLTSASSVSALPQYYYTPASSNSLKQAIHPMDSNCTGTYQYKEFCLTFDPSTNYWMCGWGQIQVTLTGPLEAGHELDFSYYQYSESNPSQPTWIWTDDVTVTANPVQYQIDPTRWESTYFGLLPFLYVKVADNNGTILFSQQTLIEPESCGNTSTTSTASYLQQQATSVQTLTLPVTSKLTTTVVETTTGFNTTEVSTVVQKVYATSVVHSYGTVTATQYVYLETASPTNSTPVPTQGSGAAPPNLGWLTNAVSEYIPNSPLVLVGSGAMVVALVSVLLVRRRRSSSILRNVQNPSELDERVLDYITEKEGAISMSKASKDLELPTEDLGEAIMRLKADGRLQGG